MNCPRCGHADLVKNGSVRGKPKRRCKNCGYQFTRTTKPGKPPRVKALALLLYLSGLSLNRIGTLCRVSAQAVLNWVRQYAWEHAEKPSPDERVVVLELDEMWHYLKKNAASFGSGKRWIALPVDSWIGSAATATSRL